jgi:homoserine O-succinyltransferase
MPVIVPNNLPAIKTLRKENIFVMDSTRAKRQDIRAQKILILNIMPLKIATENQILRLLTNSPLQIEVDFIHFRNHISKNIHQSHLDYFYKTFDEIKETKYDGMIITGAPVEMLKFEEVDYWDELRDILDWTIHNVTSTMFICWAAQAGLYYFYKIGKIIMPEKIFGNYMHRINNTLSPIVRGFDDTFIAPHSRHTDIKREEIKKIKELEIVAESEEAGVYIVVSKDMRRVFVTGHSEYDAKTIKEEYERDLAKGMKITLPKNYFPEDNPKEEPTVRWRSHAYLLYQNWLNYCVYQITPYNINDIK